MTRFGASVLMIAVAAIAVLLSLFGCASVRKFNDTAEASFQMIHIVDVLQSEHGAASDPCYVEGDYATKFVTGAHPSHAAVAAWGIGYGALHYGVSRMLADAGWDRVGAAWEVVTIADTAYAVGHNYSIGIRLGAPNTDYAACKAHFGGVVPIHDTVRK